MSEHPAADRPHHRFTEDGRRLREVLTYARRGSRFTPAQRASWEAKQQDWVIPDEAVDEPGVRISDWFAREAPLIIEIGSGIGEATAALAATRPGVNVLSLEVWRPGVATGLGLVAAAGAENVRFLGVDAIWTLENLVEPGGLEELWTFFPDPWHKKKHHKRRLVSPSFAATVTERLRPGGAWRLATDWAPYAEQMRQVLDAEPGLEGGVVPRWDERPVTKFERKGLAAGRAVIDLCYRRR